MVEKTLVICLKYPGFFWFGADGRVCEENKIYLMESMHGGDYCFYLDKVLIGVFSHAGGNPLDVFFKSVAEYRDEQINEILSD